MTNDPHPHLPEPAPTPAGTDVSALSTPPQPVNREVVLITGISGSGKSIAIHALEDAGFFCVDNLPPELLRDLVHVETEHGVQRLAVAVDVRTAGSLPGLVPLLDELQSEGVKVRSIFLSATTPALVKRFSETRRPHPLSKPGGGCDPQRLIDAIEQERGLLGELRARSTVLDTSDLRPAQLRAWVRDLVGVIGNHLTLVFQSFAFKHGVPMDADMVFDVRVLPNPYYLRELRPLTGRDQPVADYLRAQPEVGEMLSHIQVFLQRWLPSFENDQRSYLTVAIGCTGGQHRSVYFVETLAQAFASQWPTLKRHRELDARG